MWSCVSVGSASSLAIPDTGEPRGEPTLHCSEWCWAARAPRSCSPCAEQRRGTRAAGEGRDAADEVHIAVASHCRGDFHEESAPLVEAVSHLGSRSWNTLLLPGGVQGPLLSAPRLRACERRCCTCFSFKGITWCRFANKITLFCYFSRNDF